MTAVHALLRHLQARGFTGAPRVLGVDDRGREILTYLPGATIGTTRPWPGWVHSEQALTQVGTWLRRYHDATADFVPPPGAVWRTTTRAWRPGDTVGQGDAAPYNAVWAPTPGAGAQPGVAAGELVGFVDWDFAAPCPPLWDLAFVAFSWVPLHARDVVAAEGFTDLDARPRRLRLLLGAYGYTGPVAAVLDAVHGRLEDHVRGVRALARAGDPLFTRLTLDGAIDALDRALTELRQDAPSFDPAPDP